MPRFAFVRRSQDIPAGWPGILAALSHMRRLALAATAEPAIQVWAAEAVVGKDPWDVRGKVAGILARIRRDLRFTPDPDELDLVQHPLFTLLAGGGDCDCLSTLFAAAGLSQQIPIRFVVGARPGLAVPTHVLPEAWAGGQWLPAEVSSRRIPLGRYPPRFVPLGKVTL